MSSYNFKDNLTIDNNKYLKWLDITGTSRANIIGLDINNNIKINSDYGNMYLNSNGINNNFTFINVNNSNGVIIGSKLGVGFSSTENMSCNLTLVKNGIIGINTTQGTSNGYLALSGCSSLINNSKVMLYGNDHLTYPGNVNLYAGNISNGNINMYVGNDSLKMQILDNGNTNFLPDGITSRLLISDTTTNITNDLIITSTSESINATTGALQIRGGIGILGNLYLDGTISLSSATGNINFDSSQSSNSYTTGAIFLSGGLGISTTANSGSITSGGAMSIAGGVAIGKDVYIGGKTTIVDITVPTSSQTGSLVLYGGLGINGPIFSRGESSQIQLSPKINGSTTNVLFYSNNNFSSTSDIGSSWSIGQNVNSLGSGFFGIVNSDFGTVISASYSGNMDIFTKTKIKDETNAINEDDGGSFTVLGGASFKKDIYVGGSIILGSGGAISGGTGSSSYDYLTLTATDESINSMTGALVSYGGVTIQCSTDAISITNGGSFLTLGGASIGRSLFIGGPVLQIPIGSSTDRPNGEMGYIRYNSTSNQFEGYGLNNWGSLGGVIDIAQTTKILAELSPGSNDGNLRFITADNERMRINSSGNIGIGTSSPGYILDVNGNMRASNLYINYLGIGTTNPISPVHINTTFSNVAPSENGIFMGTQVDERQIIQMNSSIGSMIDFSSAGVDFNGRILYDNVAKNMKFYTDGLERGNFSNTEFNLPINLVASSNTNTLGNLYTTGGNIGINTSNPNYTLDVNGGGSFKFINLTSTDDSVNSNMGSFVTYGGITIKSSKNSSDISSGALNILGGASIAKNLYIGTGGSLNINSTVNAGGIGTGGSLNILGGTSIQKDVYIGGILTVSNNVLNNRLTILSTENGSGIGTGGSLTVLGGASISKDLYVGSTITSSSDIRLKSNIAPLKEEGEQYLKKIDNFRTIRYNYINDDTLTNHIGFIAQDFKKDFPELLRCNPGGYYSMDYQKMTVILLECIKELKSEIQKLSFK